MKFFILLLLIFAIAFADTCGGNCPSGRCPSCPCGTTKNMGDITGWCAKYGWNQNCCHCIVSHESGGNANAMLYNTNGTFDVGFWQINQSNWSACSGGKAPCDIQTNLHCAIKVYQWGGNTWKFWSTHTACGC